MKQLIVWWWIPGWLALSYCFLHNGATTVAWLISIMEGMIETYHLQEQTPES